MKKLNLVGQKFGKLTIIKFSHFNKWKNSCWKCKCECGNFAIISSGHLKDNSTKSCGCFKISKMTKHRMRKTRFYNIWANIKQRCLNKNFIYYKYYGGRGITVCQRWLKFKNFRDDMYESYKGHVKQFGKKQTTIERINNNGNYCKSNCEWATYKEQQNNTRRNSR